MAAHRTYIKSTSPDATEDLILFDDDTKITTGVEDVVEEAEAVTAETPTDVYTISGMIVRSQVPYAEALRDPPRGIYTDKPTAIRMGISIIRVENSQLLIIPNALPHRGAFVV